MDIAKFNQKGWKFFCVVLWVFFTISIIGSAVAVYEKAKVFSLYGKFDLIGSSNPSKNMFWAKFQQPIFNFDDPDIQLICEGDLTAETEELQQKAIHDRFPTNKLYLANYIHYIDKNRVMNAGNFDSLTQEERTEFFSKNKHLRESLDVAEKIDPDNALYNYYRCFSFITEAVVYIDEKEKYDAGKEVAQRAKGLYQKFGNKNRFRYKVIDEDKLNLAIKEYFKGLKKPYFKANSFELSRERLGYKFNKINNIYQYFQKVVVEFGSNISCLAPLREIARVVAFKANLSYIDGDEKNTRELLDSWRLYVAQTSADAQSFIGILVNIVIENIFLSNSCDFYNQIGDEKKLAECAKVYSHVAKFKDYMRNNNDALGKFRNRTGFCAGTMLASHRCDIPEDEFLEKIAPERMIWYKVLEQFILKMTYYGNLLVILFCCGVIAWITKLIVKKRNKLWSEQKLFIKPNRKEWLLMIFYGVVIPCAIYLIITNIDYLSGRDFFKSNFMATFYQMLLLAELVYIPSFWGVNSLVKNYCKRSNIEVNFSQKIWVVFSVILYTPWVILAIKPINKLILSQDIEYGEAPTIIVTFAGLNFIISLLTIFYLIFTACTKNLYRKLIVINILPYYAILSFMIAIILNITFAVQQKYYFHKDEIIFSKDIYANGATILEDKAIKEGQQYIKERILK